MTKRKLEEIDEQDLADQPTKDQGKRGFLPIRVICRSQQGGNCGRSSNPTLQVLVEILTHASIGTTDESPETIDGNNDRMITYFDPDGDLKLLVGDEDEQEIYVVSSKAMSLVCKPWKAMVGPDSKFIEGSSSADAAIPLPDDNVVALRILLNAAHLRFSLVPDMLSFESLLQVARLCDKFDAVGIVRPWLNGWLAYAKKLPVTASHEGWLWISWTFGLQDKFRQVARKIVDNLCFVNNKGYFYEGRKLDEQDLPPEILGMIILYK